MTSASKPGTDLLVWVDVETTGLDPRRHCLLELAMVATDASLEVEARVAAVFPVAPRVMPPEVRAMHEANGLLAECRELRRTMTTIMAIEQIDYLNDFAEEFSGRPIAGSNPSFDRAFLRRYLPNVERHFHYRSFDVNTLAYFFGVEKPRPATAHRAMDDVMSDVEFAKSLLTKFWPVVK